MKFILTMHIDPTVWDAQSESVRNEVMEGHGAFMAATKESGEFLGTHALGDPSDSAVVKVRAGRTEVEDRPYLNTKEHIGGFYLVECASVDRAYELAAMIPDAKVDGLGIEVRPVIFSAGPED
jgi:hypothetical protein